MSAHRPLSVNSSMGVARLDAVEPDMLVLLGDGAGAPMVAAFLSYVNKSTRGNLAS